MTTPAGAIFSDGSVLHIQSKRADSYPDLLVSTRRATQLATRSWAYGYFEARMKWTKGQGAYPGFLLADTAHAFGAPCPALNAELDIFKAAGNAPTTRVGELHRNIGGGCAVADQVNSPSAFAAGVDLSLDFHVYGVLWTPTGVSWWLDDVKQGQCALWDSSSHPMFLVLASRGRGGAAGDYDGTTPDVLDVQVDWVRVWQK